MSNCLENYCVEGVLRAQNGARSLVRPLHICSRRLYRESPTVGAKHASPLQKIFIFGGGYLAAMML